MSQAPAASEATTTTAAPSTAPKRNGPRRDPFPDEVKAREETDKKIAKYNEESDKLIKRLREIRDALEEKDTNRRKLVREYRDTKNEIIKIHGDVHALFEQRKAAISRLIETKREQGSNAAAARMRVSEVEGLVPEPYRTRGREAWEKTAKKKDVITYMLREVQKGVDELEFKFETTPFRNAAEERKFSMQISYLKRVPELVRAKKAEQATEAAKKAAGNSAVAEVMTSDPKELTAILIANAEKINALRAKIPPLAKKLTELVPQIEVSGNGAVELIRERDSAAEKVYKLHGEITRERNALIVKLYELRIAHNAKRMTEAEAESKKIKANIEQEKQEEASRIASAQKKMAYEKEIDTIKILTGYVKTLAPAGYFKKKEAPQQQPQQSQQAKKDDVLKSAPLAEIAEANSKATVQLVSKKAEVEETAPKKKKGKGKGKKAAAAAAAGAGGEDKPAFSPDDILKHNMEKYSLFETVSVRPPEAVKDIDRALADLEEKKKHYLKLRDEESKKTSK